MSDATLRPALSSLFTLDADPDDALLPSRSQTRKTSRSTAATKRSAGEQDDFSLPTPIRPHAKPAALTPIQASVATFVAGRARTPVAAQLVHETRDFEETDAWRHMVTPVKQRQRGRQPVESRAPSLPTKRDVQDAPIREASGERYPSTFAAAPAHVREHWGPVTTSWNAAAFRRTLAATCFRWRTLRNSGLLANFQVRTCFESVTSIVGENNSWNELLLLLFDVWNHVDRGIAESAQAAELRKQIFLSLDLLPYGDSCDSSALLTSIKAFLGEFSQVQEGEWQQERVIYYMDKSGKHLVTTRLGPSSAAHWRESVEETIVCESSDAPRFTVNVSSRERVPPGELPMMTLPLQVDLVQYKQFSWIDESYAHTVQSGKNPEWTLTLSMTWTGASMLEVDALMSARRAPVLALKIESCSLADIVKEHVPGEMTLITSAGVYAMAAICMMPRERDQWTWRLLSQ